MYRFLRKSKNGLLQRYGLRLLAIAMFAAVISGCSSFKGQDQSNSSFQNLLLQNNQFIGQTFVPINNGLDGIEVYLIPGEQSDGEIRFHIRTNPNAVSDLVSSAIPLEEVTDPGFYRFSFDPIEKSRRQYYYGFLELTGSGNLWIGHGPSDSYLNGASYQNHEPSNLQMAFHLSYDPMITALGFGSELITWTGIMLIGAFLFILPGLGLLSVLLPKTEELPLISMIILAAGIGLALYPIFFLWSNVIGLHLSPLYAFLLPIIGLLLLIWRIWDSRDTIQLKGLKERFNTWKKSENLWPDLLFMLIVVVVALTRMIAVRSLNVPMWGDSYQHTMIAQLLVDNGGLFDGWQPYADLTTFTYHFGFHTHVAALHWITDLPMYRATLWTGQILNILAVVALYPIAVRLSSNRWAGVFAVLIAGLLVSMPMYYTNWGRYTQLAGQAILLSAVFFTWRALDREKKEWPDIVLVWILLGGLALTHYRVLIFGILFIPAYLLMTFRSKNLSGRITTSLLIVMGVLVISLPWFLHLFPSNLMTVFENFFNTPSSSTPAHVVQYNTIGNLTNFAPIWLWAAGVLVLLWSFWKGNRDILIIAVWWLLILLVANPASFNLPGTGVISNFAVFIAAYIPLGLLCGVMIAEFTQFIPARLKGLFMVGVILVLSVLGAMQRISEISQEDFALVTESDIQASEWIKENIPEDSRFLVNSFFAYGNTLVVGSDGGWWLPILAERDTSLPPLTYSWETGTGTEYIEWINDLTSNFQEKGLRDDEFISMLKERNITHIYIGQRQGRVNNPGPHVLSAEQISSIPIFRPIYHKDHVWIFEIEQ